MADRWDFLRPQRDAGASEPLRRTLGEVLRVLGGLEPPSVSPAAPAAPLPRPTLSLRVRPASGAAGARVPARRRTWDIDRAIAEGAALLRGGHQEDAHRLMTELADYIEHGDWMDETVPANVTETMTRIAKRYHAGQLPGGSDDRYQRYWKMIPAYKVLGKDEIAKAATYNGVVLRTLEGYPVKLINQGEDVASFYHTVAALTGVKPVRNQGRYRLDDPVFVAKATGCNVNDVKKFLPGILSALKKHKIYDQATTIAAIATTAVETNFKTLEEAGYLPKEKQERYLASKKYATPDPITRQRYYGRGIIQLTHKYNYEKYGKLLNIDLVNNPDKAKDPDVAANVLALYIKDHGIPQLANSGQWIKVRRKVNGGTNGLDTYQRCVKALKEGELPQ